MPMSDYSVEDDCEKAARDAYRPTRVTITRTVKDGEQVKVPPGCADLTPSSAP